jgi:diguanylate cyclase (GGDEF)-like protein
MSENKMMGVSPEKTKPGEENMRERVANLGEEAVRDIAEAEHRFRSGVMTPDEVSDLALGKIEAKQARDKAEREKWMDDLTGLKNKNAYLHEAPQHIIAEHRNYRHYKQRGSEERRTEQLKVAPQCSFLMIDFDHFKKVNDEYGHAAGDQALRQMADIIREVIRTSDIPYRFGGEEFVVFLPNTNANGALHLGEVIRKKLEETVIQVVDNNGVTIPLKKTVSIGCVSTEQLECWDQSEEIDAQALSEEMMRYADAALYTAKQGGRNQVVLYTPKPQPQSGE